jgi:hypothetical protein
MPLHQRTTPKDSNEGPQGHCRQMRVQPQHCLNRPLSPFVHLGVASFFHLYDEQGYGQFKLLMKFWRSPHTITGKLMRITVAWAQFCTGIQQPILQDMTVDTTPTSRGQMANRCRCGSNGGSIELKDTFVKPLQRENDQFIMDIAIIRSREIHPRTAQEDKLLQTVLKCTPSLRHCHSKRKNDRTFYVLHYY